MDYPLFYIILFSILSGVGSVTLASVVLLIPHHWRENLMPCLISYATGTLLGAAFLGLFPQSVKGIGLHPAALVLLGGILLFFILEKLLIWRHCHEEHCQSHSASGPLILIGDALHNFIDGIVIASAFLVSPELGFTTAIAIIGHEIPQELGDFAVLLQSGYSKSKALFFNILSSLTTLIAGIGSYYFLKEISGLTPYVTGLAAASFIYIAIADLVPTLHQRLGLKSLILQSVLLMTGIITIFFISHH